MKIKQILDWADAHHERIGQRPQRDSGHACGSRRNIDNALIYGLRGMPGGSSLTQLIDGHPR